MITKPKPKYGWHGQKVKNTSNDAPVVGDRVYHESQPQEIGTVVEGPKLKHYGLFSEYVYTIEWDAYPGSTFDHTARTIKKLNP